jgi:hypothetical protein
MDHDRGAVFRVARLIEWYLAFRLHLAPYTIVPEAPRQVAFRLGALLNEDDEAIGVIEQIQLALGVQ